MSNELSMRSIENKLNILFLVCSTQANNIKPIVAFPKSNEKKMPELQTE